MTGVDNRFHFWRKPPVLGLASRSGAATSLRFSLPRNSGVDNAELAEAGRNLKTAAGLDEQIAALNRFQKVHNQVMPFTIFANAEEFVVVDESVKGVAPTSSGVMLFDGAYVTSP